MTEPLPTADMTVAALLERWPRAMRVFFRRRMACVGCVMAPFETLREASTAYGIAVDALLRDIDAAAQHYEKGEHADGQGDDGYAAR